MENILRSLGFSKEDVVIGLNLRFFMGRVFARVLYSVVKTLAKYLEANKHVKLLYIPFGCGSFPDMFFDDDLRIGYLIGRFLHDVSGNRYYVLSQEFKPSTILGVFKLVKAVICVRYHALVLAHMCGTPVLNIAYDIKVLEFAELVNGLGRRIVGRVVKPESVSVDLVLSFLRRYVG
ncbi:hypothetical protein Smar_1537 [Staphylothermus marinus F1]|uniref:Polysaccharide pyruvyl transferase domain-containing protein n=1 Tax=Staphylothermus marinus (strain ATCC 43588 / DSM 3639 / JCM 9404 / F1) TaxID=399550 RepID=A3DPR3_STAMF|nr:polysaccharide pyruvyl transferase family protein [Staphylothermus marinus]ABN70623.1 hypothetical protein Smar_1537 [Staphylothermus marinus F1]